ncbi:hypothetical protein QA642_16890 [Bradyrhizobium sp. CB2312]|nr:hypothetical protein [Bradyrhizobium sp. CB2312]WFU76978.1 hypothetical protein QA642_16890 [Bradyrhizobium sp. CB2312]
MDAVLASIEVEANKAKGDSKINEFLVDLKNRRDEFGKLLKTRIQSGGGAWAHAEADLERQWAGLEAQVRNYFESVGAQLEHQHDTFKSIAAVQAKAWHDAAEKLHDAATKIVDARRADVDTAVKQMKSDAAEAGARLQRLKHAGTESWSVLSAALAESRKAFDEANHVAWKALKGTASPKG